MCFTYYDIHHSYDTMNRAITVSHSILFAVGRKNIEQLDYVILIGNIQRRILFAALQEWKNGGLQRGERKLHLSSLPIKRNWIQWKLKKMLRMLEHQESKASQSAAFKRFSLLFRPECIIETESNKELSIISSEHDYYGMLRVCYELYKSRYILLYMQQLQSMKNVFVSYGSNEMPGMKKTNSREQNGMKVDSNRESTEWKYAIWTAFIFDQTQQKAGILCP